MEARFEVLSQDQKARFIQLRRGSATNEELARLLVESANDLDDADAKIRVLEEAALLSPNLLAAHYQIFDQCLVLKRSEQALEHGLSLLKIIHQRGDARHALLLKLRPLVSDKAPIAITILGELIQYDQDDESMWIQLRDAAEET